MPTHSEIAARTGLTAEQVAAEAATYAQYGISAGDRVSLAVSSEPDDVTGTVKRLYRNAIGTLVADVELLSGEIFPQNVEFLTRVGGGKAATYAETVTRLAREYRSYSTASELIPPADYVGIVNRLHAAADAAGIDRPVAARDLFDEINAEPVA